MLRSLGLLVLLTVGCDRSSTVTPDEAPAPRVPDENTNVTPTATELEIPDPDPEAPTGASTIQVQLPRAPTLSGPRVPERHDDGAFSIHGLRANLDANVADGDAGKEVIVRAWVQEIYVAPECPRGEVCPPPKQPYVWVTDSKDERGKKRAMLVANYAFTIPEWDAKRWKDQPLVVLEVGKQYEFKGRFKRFSDTGFAHDRGLLEFIAYKQHGVWIYPPGAPWHPVEIQRMEEANARLAEEAKKSAR